MAWRVPSLNGRHGHKKGRNSKISVPITKPMTRRACWALKEVKNLIWGPSYGRLKKSCDKKWVFFRVASFKRPLRHQNLTKSKNFTNQHVAKSLRFILGFEIFEKSHFWPELWTIPFGSKLCHFLANFSATPYFFLFSLFSLPLCTFFCNFR